LADVRIENKDVFGELSLTLEAIQTVVENRSLPFHDFQALYLARKYLEASDLVSASHFLARASQSLSRLGERLGDIQIAHALLLAHSGDFSKAREVLDKTPGDVRLARAMILSLAARSTEGRREKEAEPSALSSAIEYLRSARKAVLILSTEDASPDG